MNVQHIQLSGTQKYFFTKKPCFGHRICPNGNNDQKKTLGVIKSGWKIWRKKGLIQLGIGNMTYAKLHNGSIVFWRQKHNTPRIKTDFPNTESALIQKFEHIEYDSLNPHEFGVYGPLRMMPSVLPMKHLGKMPDQQP